MPKFISCPLLFLAAAFFAIFCFTADMSFAQNAHDDYKKIQRDLKTHQKKLESVKKAEESVISELRKTTAELEEIEGQLKAQRDKIKKLQGNMAALQEEINNNKQHLEKQSSFLKKRFKVIQKIKKEKDAILILLGGEDFSQILRMLRYLNDIASYDSTLIGKYKESVKILSNKQDKLKAMASDLKAAETKLSKLDESLKEKKKERETLLISVRKEKRIYERMIKELQEASNRLMHIIQESERKEREARKKKGAKAEEHDDSEFAKFKGKLPWPVSGTVAIQYGSQVDPLFNLPVFRSGIHIKTPGNTKVKAVHDGKVVFADEFKGYGLLVIVSHGGGYHTLYGNLSKIFSKNGAIIKEHEALGETGDAPAIGTTGMYFELRYKGKPLDPQQWLKK
jgi:septal ring factor EnvC (AmiA/AmiB activator)